MARLTHAREKELRKLLDHFEQRKHRALRRLESDEEDRWCFAVLGLNTPVSDYEFGDLAVLRQVREPPGEVELATALSDKSVMSAVGRYSQSINHELAVLKDIASEERAAFTFAWWIISALRIRSLAEILIPVVASQSWSTIAAAPEGTCSVKLLEDIPHAARLDAEISVMNDDLDWVENHILAFADLLEVPKFRLAVEALNTHQHQSSLRMMTASIWAGVEALFAINAELRFRLAALAASYLAPRGEQRVSQYRRIKKLYDVRSKAVHGASIDGTKLHKHVLEARKLLSELLCKMVDEERVPEEEDFVDVLFG